MENQHYPFHEWKFSCEEGVEDNGEGSYRDDDQSAVPTFGNVGRVVEDDEALYLGAGKVSD